MPTPPTHSVRAAAVQLHCTPGDVPANLSRIAALTRLAADDGAELVVVPETATTGYFMADRLDTLAEPEDGPTARALSELARACGVHLAVGMALRDGSRFFDAQLLFGPDGAHLATYRKVHLFSSEREWYAAGDAPVVVDTAFGKVGMTICYDLMFPEYIRRLADLGAQLVVNSTNWITDAFQREVWGWSGPTVQGLAGTRALENGVWLVMANCVGPEAGFDSIGHSCVVAPSGRIMASVGDGQGVAAAPVLWRHSDELDRWRSIATYRQDRRPELY